MGFAKRIINSTISLVRSGEANVLDANIRLRIWRAARHRLAVAYDAGLPE